MKSVVQRLWGGVAIILLTAGAPAQDLARPASVRFAKGDWTFVPVVKRVSGVWSSPGVLALRNKAFVVGDNIVAIWYESPVLAGGTWTASSWTSQDHWQAITHTKSRFAIGNEYDLVWPTDDAVTQPLNPAEPVPYFHGLLEFDPLSSLPVDENRDRVVSALTELGYQSASVSFEQIGVCEGEVVLEALTQTAIMASETSPTSAVLESFFAAAVPTPCAGIGSPPPDGFVPGTAIPLPGIPLNPGNPWQRDSQLPVQQLDCIPSTDCCYAASIIFPYIRKGTNGIEFIEYCAGLQTWNCPPRPDGTCPAVPSCPAPVGALPNLELAPVTCGLTF